MTDPLEQRARAVHRILEESGWRLGLHAVHTVLAVDRDLGSRLDAVDAALQRLQQERERIGRDGADTRLWQEAVTDTLTAMRAVLAALCGQPPTDIGDGKVQGSGDDGCTA